MNMTWIALALLAAGGEGVGEAASFEAIVARMAWTRMEARITLTVKREGKTPLSKQMRVMSAAGTDRQDLLATFTSPANMRGTSFLAHARDGGDDEYFLYLRTLRRVKRVPTCSENFMLRDFLSLYFMKPRLDLWSFQRLDAPSAEGLTRYEGRPRLEKTRELTGYARVIHEVDASRGLIMGTWFYDAEGALMRRQRITRYEEVCGVQVPMAFSTEDLVEGAGADIEVLEIKIDQDLPAGVFSVRHLKRL
jgi:hypothetical protein